MGTGHEELHRRLHAFNQRRLKPDHDASGWEFALTDEYEHRVIEMRFLESERELVRDRAAEAPRDPQRFLAWFEHLAIAGPGQGDPLFPWLAHEASLEEMRWFLLQ